MSPDPRGTFQQATHCVTGQCRPAQPTSLQSLAPCGASPRLCTSSEGSAQTSTFSTSSDWAISLESPTMTPPGAFPQLYLLICSWLQTPHFHLLFRSIIQFSTVHLHLGDTGIPSALEVQSWIHLPHTHTQKFPVPTPTFHNQLTLLTVFTPLLNSEINCWCWSSNTLATWCEDPTHWKSPWCWERLRAGGEGGNRGDGCMASSIQWTWVWANSRRYWRTGKPGMPQSTRSESQTRPSRWRTPPTYLWPSHPERARSHPISEAKQGRAWLVLGWEK